MKLTIKTVVLQEMMSRAVKGASQNKLLPLTSMMLIELEDKKLTLVTTDASNYLYISRDDVEGDDFYVTVQVDTFSKLVSKMTSENITLELDESVLTVTGNGTYKLELPLDESGQLVEYPDPMKDKTKVYDFKSAEIALHDVKTMLAVNKAALAVTLEVPVYMNYYIGDKVVTTDTYKICQLNNKFFDTAILLAPDTANLLDVMTEEKIQVDMDEDIIIFRTKDCTVRGHIVDDIDEFAIDAISELLDEEFASSCKIRRNMLLSTLDRIGLFVGAYDDGAITLTFTKEGLAVSSAQSDGVETICYVESKKFKPYTCQIKIAMLEQQLKANEADILELQYGNDRSIKFVDGAVTQVVALLESDE